MTRLFHQSLRNEQSSPDGARSINYVGGVGFVANTPSKKTFETMQSTNNFGLGFSRTEQ